MGAILSSSEEMRHRRERGPATHGVADHSDDGENLIAGMGGIQLLRDTDTQLFSDWIVLGKIFLHKCLIDECDGRSGFSVGI